MPAGAVNLKVFMHRGSPKGDDRFVRKQYKTGKKGRRLHLNEAGAHRD